MRTFFDNSWLGFFLLIVLGIAGIAGCAGGDTSSGQCQTFTDANNNPVTQCSQ